MKKLLGLSAVLVASALWAEPAFADHQTGSGLENVAPAPPTAPDISAQTEEITGRVVDIDHQRGMLMLQTRRGLLALQGPPEALKQVDVGDVVRVKVAFGEEPAPNPAQSPLQNLGR
jgi:hypothetical protein